MDGTRMGPARAAQEAVQRSVPERVAPYRADQGKRHTEQAVWARIGHSTRVWASRGLSPEGVEAFSKGAECGSDSCRPTQTSGCGCVFRIGRPFATRKGAPISSPGGEAGQIR
jgi:hypothetical protein